MCYKTVSINVISSKHLREPALSSREYSKVILTVLSMVCHGMASRLSSTCSRKKLVGTSRRIESLNNVDIDRSYEKTVDLGRILQIICSPLVPGSFEM